MIVIRRVIGNSMLPTLRPGAVVLAARFKRPKLGDVVIAAHHGREIIKRISAIGEQGYFLLGDNPSHSSDSRAYGWFSGASLKAVVIGRFT